MIRISSKLRCLLTAAFVALGAFAWAAENPFIGRWALTIPGGAAGWLGIEEKDGQLKGSLLWGGGSVLPVKSVKVDGDTLTVTRESKRHDAKNNTDDVITDTITAKLSGDDMKLATSTSKNGGTPSAPKDFMGHRIPPVPPTPDLSKVKFGAPIVLFNGKDLTGWRLVEPNAQNGWSVQDGLLVNRIEHGKHFGNLRTDREFEDFNLTLETRTQEGSNSGIYLRGIYEIQVAETYGKPVDPHNMGALYSRITPLVAAEKPVGEWQTFDITLVDRHVTVILNGKKIIDNQPILGVTGGAMTSDEMKPGPLMLQGDHTTIDYRNIVLKPVIK
jgi:hypothetical protein